MVAMLPQILLLVKVMLLILCGFTKPKLYTRIFYHGSHFGSGLL